MSAQARKHTEDAREEQEKARRDFYRIVKERLDSRLERGETYTTTHDLYSGYEALAREGFGDTPPSQIVAQVIGYAGYRGRLFYARHTVTHKAERSGPGRVAPYRLYLRADATPPKDYVLVSVDTPKDRIAQTIAEAKGASDATLHVLNGAVTPESTQPEPIDYAALSRALTMVIQAQAEMFQTVLGALGGLTRDAGLAG